MTVDVHLLHPLNDFYEQAGCSLPPVIQVEGGDVPEPYRSLLVHEQDMTPTVERVYRRGISLRVFKRVLYGSIFSRQVVLELENDGREVTFAAIKIYLALFPAEARRLILECTKPLGKILQTQGIAHISRPAAYFQVRADPVIGGALNLTQPCLLYGRQNVLRNPSQHILAQIVEILPPAVGLSP